MSERPDLAQMGEPELRAWLERLPAQELVEIVVSYVRAFLRDGVDEFGASAGALGGLLEMSFPQIISYLKENARLPELSRLRVDGDEVKYQTAAGSEILLNATGLQDGPGLPGLGGRGGYARSAPDPNRTLRPNPVAAAAMPADPEPPAATPGSSVQEPVAPRPGARRMDLWGEGGSGTGEVGNDPAPRARTAGRPPTAPASPPSAAPPARPAEPPRARPSEPPRPGAAAAPKGGPAAGPGGKDKGGGDKKGGGGKKDDRFSMLEFD